MKETEFAYLLVTWRGPSFDWNDRANCIGVEQTVVPAEVLTNGVIKMPFFYGIVRRLTFLTPRGRDIEIHRQRDQKLAAARQRRADNRKKQTQMENKLAV